MLASEFSWDEFFKVYWRRSPLLIKNGAKLFLKRRLEANDLSKVRRLLDFLPRLSRQRLQNGTEFFQNLPLEALPGLARKEVAEALPSAEQWLDIVTTDGSNSGIGCHFDDSDNFVIQQEGTKLWRVGLATAIADDLRVRRNGQDPSVGSLPEELATEIFTLEPDDVLYLPFHCPHQGVSLGPSVSASWVINPVIPGRILQNILLTELQSMRSLYAAANHAAELFAEIHKALPTGSLNLAASAKADGEGAFRYRWQLRPAKIAHVLAILSSRGHGMDERADPDAVAVTLSLLRLLLKGNYSTLVRKKTLDLLVAVGSTDEIKIESFKRTLRTRNDLVARFKTAVLNHFEPALMQELDFLGVTLANTI